MTQALVYTNLRQRIKAHLLGLLCWFFGHVLWRWDVISHVEVYVLAVHGMVEVRLLQFQGSGTVG